MKIAFLDGDFPVEGAKCQYLCSPTCHPGQVGPRWRYGCTSKKHPQYYPGEFVPLVECGGDPAKCECKKGKETK